MPRRPNANVAIDNDSSDDEGIVCLDGPPEHLKTVLNESSPIVVDSSDDDDENWHSPATSRSGLKRRIPSDDDEPLAPKHAKIRNAAAGSSRRPKIEPAAIFVDDSDNEGTPEEDAPPPSPPQHILPKSEYLVPIVLEIIPDADPQWVKEDLERLMDELKTTSSAPGQDAVDRVINAALETGVYPKVGLPLPPEEEPDYADPEYHRAQRTGAGYTSISMELLLTLFPSIPVAHLRIAYEEVGEQLVPAYQLLHRQSSSADKPYTELKKKRNTKGKGRVEQGDTDDEADAEAVLADVGGALEARKERVFLRAIMAKALEKDKEDLAFAAAREKAEADHVVRKAAAEARGDGVECQCCFDTEAPEDSAACPDGHLFCHDCVRQHAETKLGDQIAVIRCMDGSGCEEMFTDATLATVLSEKTMSLYHRLKQMKELELADIPGLETCPHCPFAMVIETPNEKLFRCLNPTCMKITCRQCRRPDHIPKRCEEVEADLKLDKRHAVEEAMSEALMRKCPQCGKPYVKESGCNKIMCHGCGTMSCYICQAAIKGYEHFNQLPGTAASTAVDGRCRLWDPKEGDEEAARIVQARDAAAQRVLQEAAQGGVELTEDDVRVDAPPVAPMRRPHLPAMPLPAPPMVRAGGLLDNRLQMIDAQHRVHMQNRAAAIAAAAPPGPGNQVNQVAPLEQLQRQIAVLQRAQGARFYPNMAADDDVLQRAQRQLEELRRNPPPNPPLFNPPNLVQLLGRPRGLPGVLAPALAVPGGFPPDALLGGPVLPPAGHGARPVEPERRVADQRPRRGEERRRAGEGPPLPPPRHFVLERRRPGLEPLDVNAGGHGGGHAAGNPFLPPFGLANDDLDNLFQRYRVPLFGAEVQGAGRAEDVQVAERVGDARRAAREARARRRAAAAALADAHRDDSPPRQAARALLERINMGPAAADVNPPEGRAPGGRARRGARAAPPALPAAPAALPAAPAGRARRIRGRDYDDEFWEDLAGQL